MKLVYPAVFHKDENDGLYKGYFPDLPMCYSQGATLNDCLDDAHYNMNLWIMAELEDEDPHLPYISDFDQIELKEGEFIRNVAITLRLTDGYDE